MSTGDRYSAEQPFLQLVDVGRAGCDSRRCAEYAPPRCTIRGRLLATRYLFYHFVLVVETDSSFLLTDWTGTLEEGEIVFIPVQEVVDPETGLKPTAIIGDVVVRI